MSKLIISSDSTCDLNQQLIDRYQIRILPLSVTLGDTLYRDCVDITPDGFTHTTQRSVSCRRPLRST